MIEFELGFTAHIPHAIKQAILTAKEKGCMVWFKLGGETVNVYGDSDADLIFRDWQRTSSRCIFGPIGPYPKAELTEEDLVVDKANRKRVFTQKAHEYIARLRDPNGHTQKDDFLCLTLTIAELKLTAKELRTTKAELLEWERLYGSK